MKHDNEHIKNVNNMFGRSIWDDIRILSEEEEKFASIRNSEHMTPKHAYCDPKAKVTVVVFEDGSKEICRCAKGDKFNEYAGICICLAKHFYGKSKIEKLNSKNKTIYNNVTKTRKEQK